METDVHHRFLAEVAPALRLAVRRYVRPVAPEDYHDLTQEGLAIAWRSSLALVRRGRPILPAPIVFYTVRRLRSGRRFLRSGRTDVMSAACQLDGNSRLISIHAEFHSPIDGDQFSALIDRLPDLSADSSAAVWKRLDLAAFLSSLSDTQRLVLARTVAGYGPTAIAAQLGLSPPRIVQIRRGIAREARRFWEDCSQLIARGPP